MAGLNFEAEYVDSFDLLKVFAAEGVEFLLSSEGKVYIYSLVS
jgi:nucleoredoxin